MQKATLFSILYMLVNPRMMEGSDEADYGYAPCYEWDSDSEAWVTETLVSAVAEESKKSQTGFKFQVTLNLQYDSSSFYYYGYCDQTCWYNVAVDWTVGASESDGNYNFFYSEGVYDEDTKECVLSYANEGSTPLVSGEEIVLRNEKKRDGACGVNLYLDYEDDGSNLASTTTVTIYTNNGMMITVDALVIAIIGMTYLF